MVDDAKAEGVSLVNLKRKIVYAALLFALSALLLIAVTLGWFQSITVNQVNGISFYYPGVTFAFYQSVDANADGVPDVDGSGNIIYTMESPNKIVISNLYPMCSTAFKVVIGATPGKCISIELSGLSAPGALTPTVDVTKALRIKYIDPTTQQLVDKSLYEMMDSSRNISLISNYPVDANGNFTFCYTIYMDSAADNEYNNQTLTIDKAIFYATQEGSGSSN